MEAQDFPGGSVAENPPANAGDTGLIPGLGRSPGEGNATQASILIWEIPWTEEPSGLQSKWFGCRSQTRLKQLNNNNGGLRATS